jgi:hypothetical protein
LEIEQFGLHFGETHQGGHLASPDRSLPQQLEAQDIPKEVQGAIDIDDKDR